MSSFYLILPSNSCPKTQPDNVAGKFRIDYENDIKISDGWEAALTEFNYNYMPVILKKGLSATYYTNILKGDSHFLPIKFKPAKDRHGHDSFAVEYDKLNKFGLTITIESDGFNKSEKGYKSIHFTSSKHKKFRINSEPYVQIKNVGETTNGRVYGIINDVDFPKEEISVIFTEYKLEKDVPQKVEIIKDDITFIKPETLVDYLKKACFTFIKSIQINDKGYFTFELLDHITGIEFDPILASVLGLTSKIYNDKKIIAESLPNLSSYLDNMYIYTNLTKPINVGGIEVPLLKSIWIDKSKHYGETVHVSMDYPMYLPVSKTNINNIEVNIRDDSGRIISFPYGSKTSLAVHFRKIITF